MSNNKSILSDQDIELITGYQLPKKQCETLTTAGVWFIVRKDGRPCTTWDHVNNPIKHRTTSPVASEPDWEAME